LPIAWLLVGWLPILWLLVAGWLAACLGSLAWLSFASAAPHQGARTTVEKAGVPQ
jgi:amino acid permease